VLTAMAGLLFFLQLGHAARKQDRSELYLLSRKHSTNACMDTFFRTGKPNAVATFPFIHNIFSNIFPKTNVAQFPSYLHI